jgi:cellobiose-specific phosphotransferase system component IIC
MKLRTTLVGAVFVLLALSTSSARSNTITPEDSVQISALGKRVNNLASDLNQISKSMMLSSGLTHDLICLFEISDQAVNVAHYSYATGIVVHLASVMSNADDEMWALVDAQGTLSALLNALDTAHNEMNKVAGRCRAPLVYDNAKSILGLTTEMKIVVAPMLARVQAALPPGIGR